MAQDSGNTKYFFVLFGFLIFSMLLLFIAFISGGTNSSNPDSNSTTKKGSRVTNSLKFVIVVARHGNRGTIIQIPNDPYPINNTEYWPFGQGALTPQGRKQMYNLGVKVRSLYNGFLAIRYDVNEFYASSTAMDRTLLSGEAFLAGLFPQIDPLPWEKMFPSQLIPLYSNSLDKTPKVEFCDRVLQIRNSSLAEFEKQNDVLLAGFKQYISKYSGMTINNDIEFYGVFDTIMSESTEGFSLPSWMEQILPHPLYDIFGKIIIENVAATNELVSLTIGDFYQEVFGLMKSKVEDTLSPDRKMYLYSGHDFTLISLQAVLGIPKQSIKSVILPGSAMIFELHHHPDKKEFTTQVLYIDGSSEDLAPTHLPIPGCQFSCTFNHIATISQPFITNTSIYEQECGYVK